jgi:hypothetical protein
MRIAANGRMGRRTNLTGRYRVLNEASLREKAKRRFDRPCFQTRLTRPISPPWEIIAAHSALAGKFSMHVDVAGSPMMADATFAAVHFRQICAARAAETFCDHSQRAIAIDAKCPNRHVGRDHHENE